MRRIVREATGGWTWDPDVAYTNNSTGLPGRCKQCQTARVSPCLASIRRGSQPLCARCKARQSVATRQADPEKLTRTYEKIAASLRTSEASRAAIKKAQETRRRSEDEARRLAVEGGWTPYETVAYENKDTPWPGTCNDCGAEVAPRLGSVVRGHGACTHCAGNARLDERTARAEAKLRGYTPDPDAPYPGAGVNWPGTCDYCGARISPRLAVVMRGTGTACRHCSADVRGEREREHFDAHARQVAERSGYTPDPSIPYPGMQKTWPGTCNACNRRIQPRLAGIYYLGNGACKYCAGVVKRSDAEARQIAQERGNYTPAPHIPYPGVDTKWPGTCNGCGNLIAPKLNNIITGFGVCRYCANMGFDYTAPARVYMIYNLELSAAKVGVAATAHDTRLEKFRRRGWRVYYQRHYATGAEAVEEESRILAQWRAAGFPEAVTAADMPMGGWTETAPLSALPGWELLLAGDGAEAAGTPPANSHVCPPHPADTLTIGGRDGADHQHSIRGDGDQLAWAT